MFLPKHTKCLQYSSNCPAFHGWCSFLSLREIYPILAVKVRIYGGQVLRTISDMAANTAYGHGGKGNVSERGKQDSFAFGYILLNTFNAYRNIYEVADVDCDYYSFCVVSG